ncbi:hypothetical protein HHK36_021704 [Tetracentron sinense]|uniref:Uncharacterized protein n=1 Tax=Tetracentron sinense TaxID=13715 RepID=A0A834YTK1_TETSI|nr:hypothetical protein HHK36_021704 [Tetracentron sinense]
MKGGTMKDTGKGAKSQVKLEDGGRKDRKSGTGMNGSPKKNGHGGKFTWSGDGISHAEIGVEKEVVDVKDPNFEDPEEVINNCSYPHLPLLRHSSTVSSMSNNYNLNGDSGLRNQAAGSPSQPNPTKTVRVLSLILYFTHLLAFD